MNLLAQESVGHMVVDALRSNSFWVFLAICVLAGTAKHIVGMILKHRERLAMIDAGMRPDAADADCEATVQYEKCHKSA